MNLRRATHADIETCHAILWASVKDFAERRGMPLSGSVEDWWAAGESIHRFLADHAAHWWMAEDETGAIGFARSIARENFLELTEFFVLPKAQTHGVGRALLERAFPNDETQTRSIIATTDTRAIARYYRAGVTARFPIFSLIGAPRASDAWRASIDARAIDLDRDRAMLVDMERAALGFARSHDELQWLAAHREGFIYSAKGQTVGFGFVSAPDVGPFVARDETILPSMLLHLETRAAERNDARIEIQIAAPNTVGMQHLLARGFHVDPWVNLLMSNRAFGDFTRIVPFGPPIFL